MTNKLQDFLFYSAIGQLTANDRRSFIVFCGHMIIVYR